MNVDGKKIKIIGIKEVKLDLPIEVYNLDSEEFDNFVVDKEKVVVHNSEMEGGIFRAG